MKKVLLKFAQNTLSREEMRMVKGGIHDLDLEGDGDGAITDGCKIYCGYTAWYSGNPYPTKITGYALCGKATLSECKKSFTTGHGYSSFQIHGCWSVGCPS